MVQLTRFCFLSLENQQIQLFGNRDSHSKYYSRYFTIYLNLPNILFKESSSLLFKESGDIITSINKISYICIQIVDRYVNNVSLINYSQNYGSTGQETYLYVRVYLFPFRIQMMSAFIVSLFSLLYAVNCCMLPFILTQYPSLVYMYSSVYHSNRSWSMKCISSTNVHSSIRMLRIVVVRLKRENKKIT